MKYVEKHFLQCMKEQKNVELQTCHCTTTPRTLLTSNILQDLQLRRPRYILVCILLQYHTTAVMQFATQGHNKR